MLIEPPEHPRLVERPSDGTPALVDTLAAFEDVLERLTEGSGSVAADTERASGFRYSDRAYLLQLHRAGSGTFLLDPIALGSLHRLQAVIGPLEWVFHAGATDLPSIHELGLAPAHVFDTEIAARLLNLPHVGLGPLVEDLLGVHLKKEHAAADWSTRPLPSGWLDYAALDVEYLIPLAHRLDVLLVENGKRSIAVEEFEQIRTSPGPGHGPERWRKLHGVHSLHGKRPLRIARELWNERDAAAREQDLSPHRLIPDSAIVAAAASNAETANQLLTTRGFNGRQAHTLLERWWQAVERGRSSNSPISLRDPDEVPSMVRSWARRRPLASARLALAREDLGALAQDLDMPHENLLAPRLLRQLAWRAPERTTSGWVEQQLRGGGARRWQIERTAAVITAAFETARDAVAQAE